MTPLYGTAVQDYYLDLVRKNFAARKARLETVRTREDAERYIADVRSKIAALFPFPAEKTPLDASETGSVDFGSFVMYKVIYHSRPEYPVTASLYLPKAEGKVPAVLFLCGHSQNGKASDIYQTCQRALAMKGYAVLAVDPVSQGERLQFLDIPGFSPGCCGEHNIIGKQLLLTGETMGAWRAWDAIRGLDYLLSRPEVDAARVGVTGNSGGGTMTTFVNALEARFAMAAPSCYITTWLHNVENELPADSEQMPPGTFAVWELDARIAGRTRAQKLEQLRSQMEKEGAENAVRLTIGTGDHGYSKTNREAMYSLFNDTAKVGVSPEESADIPLSSEQELSAAPGGQVRNLPGNRYVRAFAAEKATALAGARKTHGREELCAILRRLLSLDDPFTPHFRILRFRTEGSAVYSRFGLETEPDGRLMCVLKLKSDQAFYHLPDRRKVILYIPHLDAQDELEELVFPEDAAVYGLDVRGIGECTPSGCDQPQERDFFNEYQFDYHYASLGLMFGKPVLSGKVKDILCAAELLSQTGAQIEVHAKGQGTLPALIAALLSEKITALKLSDAPESWESMVRTPIPEFPLSAMIPGVLAETDLPELRRALAGKLL